MIGVMDFVLGGGAPFLAAAVAYALAWRHSRRAGAAWSVGAIVGYAAGVFALEARDNGLAESAIRLVRATESHERLALLALTAAVPALGATLAGRRGVEWLLAAPLCVAAPAWLLWGKTARSQQLRDAGFADDAVVPGAVVLVLGAIAAAMLAAWSLWGREASVEATDLPRLRGGLAMIAAIGAAAGAALTGALVYGQMFGVLVATLGGCTTVAWLVGDKVGPEAARGPALMLFGGLLIVAATYSQLQPWQAAALAAAFVLPVGWLPGLAGQPKVVQAAARTMLCLVPLTVVIWRAAATFIENERQQQPEEADNPYFGM